MHDDNVLRGKFDALVGVGDSGVVPFGDFAEKYSRQRLRSEIQRGIDAGNVVRRNHGSHYGGKVQDAESVLILESLELIVVQEGIGCAEIHSAFGHLLDAAARADGLIVDLKIGVLLVVLVEPLGIHGVRKCRTRSVDREHVIRPQNSRDGENYQKHSCNSLHSSSPSEMIVFSQ